MKYALLLMLAAFGSATYAQGDYTHWDRAQRAQRSVQVELAMDALDARTQALRQPAQDRKAAEYSENRHRCESALRVAELCGKFTGRFSCDAQGFVPQPTTAADARSVPGNAAALQIDRCALRAANGV